MPNLNYAEVWNPRTLGDKDPGNTVKPVHHTERKVA